MTKEKAIVEEMRNHMAMLNTTMNELQRIVDNFDNDTPEKSYRDYSARLRVLSRKIDNNILRVVFNEYYQNK